VKVVTVYTPGSLHNETLNALERYVLGWGVNLELTEISADDPFAYARVLAGYWQAGEDFMVVEPDIVVRPDIIQAFRTCPCLYGCFPYAWLTDVGPALGCTWFRAEFTAKYPNAMREVQAENVSWNQVDVVLMRHILARKHKEQPHVHLPAAKHLNPKKQLMEGRPAQPLMTVPLW
jgi:hypothetical protein